MTKRAFFIFSLFFVSCVTFAYGENFHDFLQDEVEKLSIEIERFKSDCIESELDVYQWYYLNGARDQLELIVDEYENQIR